MSHVYTFEEIVAIPPELTVDQAAFEQGLDMTRAGFEDLTQSGLVTGAFIYGSSIFKATNVCSDIDTLVAVGEFNAETLLRLQSLVGSVRDETGTLLSLTAYTIDQLTSGRHDERAVKVAWMQERAKEKPDCIIGSNPIELIQPLSDDPIGEGDQYFSSQLTKIAWPSLHGFKQDREGTLELILSAPQRIGRMAVQTLMHVGRLPEGSMADMRKDTIATALADIFGKIDPRIIELQDDIRGELGKYMQTVAAVRTGDIAKHEYEAQLYTALTHYAPKAIELIERVRSIYRLIAAQGGPVKTPAP